ncbi:matrix metalloproteinase-17-like [Branchiostoma lanceolatum]|uniref:matrix metalloproteinase-17-like n=1 Tax=Branchiostoma lanceolatum TaxID=7740 RepID=UPI003455F562
MRPLDLLLIIGLLAWELAVADTSSRDSIYEVTEWNSPNEIGENQTNTTSWMDTGPVAGGADDKESDDDLDNLVCGFDDSVLDVTTHDSSGRVKRYSLYANKWKKKHLYYRIENSPHNNEAEKYRVQNTVARAIKLWSDASPLTFYEAKDGQKADFLVKFIKGDHNDGYPFDGEGGIYAHAFFPQDGDVHFDNDEVWALKQENSPKKDLFIIAAHELGHSLGLGHSKVDGAVMRPKYRDIMKHKDIEKLSSDDTAAIQAVYGPCPKVEYWLKDLLKRRTKPRSPTNRRRPSTCSGPFDAMFMGSDMRTYVMRGRYYWKLNEEQMIGRPQPLLIKHRWPGLPGNVNAAVTSYYTKRTYFFKGDRLWRYNDNILDSNFPIKIKGTGLPKNPDAALVWGPKNRIVIFRGKKFWVWNEFTKRVDMGFPKLIRKYWHGVPNHLDTALRWKNGITYFFKSGYYWKFEDDLEKTAKCYPRPVALYWSSCGGTSLERYGT